MPPFFTIEDVCVGLTKLASRKASNLQYIKGEIHKLIPKDVHLSINDMFNHALQHYIPNDWTTNWIKPLYKDGDINQCKLLLNNHGHLTNRKTIWDNIIKV